MAVAAAPGAALPAPEHLRHGRVQIERHRLCRITAQPAVKALACPRDPALDRADMARLEPDEQAIAEILAGPLPERCLRSNPRVIKRKMSNWPVKRPEHRHPPKPTKHPENAITVRYWG